MKRPRSPEPGGTPEQHRLEEAARRYRDFTELSQDWYWEMDENLRFTYFSKEFEETTGISLGGIIGKTRWEGLGAEDYSEVDWEEHKRTLEKHQPFHGFEYPSRKIPGCILWFRASGKPRFNARGQFTGYMGIASEITAYKEIEYRLRETNAQQQKLIDELKSAHRELEQKHRELQSLSEEFRAASIADPLTNTYNRRFFFESIARMLSAARRHHHPLSIVMIDIDHFKRINDIHGHPAGDSVLRAVAAIWKEGLREEDILARFGGEEFILALPNTDRQAAVMAAERLRSRLFGQPIQLHGDAISVTASSGVAQYHPDEDSIEGAIKRADLALYSAKHSGRNKVVSH